MRAFASDKFGDISDLKLQDLPKPTPAADEILVQVRAAAVNPADLKVLQRTGAASFLHASVFPLILGYDFSGVVAEVGASAGSHKVGDEVYGHLPYARSTRNGTFAEFVAVGGGTAGPKSKAVTHEQAAASATSAATALQVMRDKHAIAAGARVLVNGASGGVGYYAVQIAKALGATVSATASAGKQAFCTTAGADRVYDYKVTPLSAIAEKFDLVFDVASNSSFGICAPLLVPGGAYISLLPSPGLFVGIARSWFSSKKCGFVVVKPVTADFAQISKWFDDGKLVGQLDSTYPLAELPAALERYRSGAASGKIAITI